MNTSFRFAVVGDSRGKPHVIHKILDRLDMRGDLAFGVHTGDIVQKYPARKEVFEEFLDRIKKLSFPLYLVRGNHDIGAFRAYDIPVNTAWEKGDYLFAVIDNADDRADLQWVEEKFSNTEKGIFAFSHKPIYDVVIPDTGKRTGHIMGGKLGGNSQAKKLVHLADKYDVEAWVAGHYHSKAINRVRGKFTQILEGRGGAPQYGNPIGFGYTLFHCYDDLWHAELKNIEI